MATLKEELKFKDYIMNIQKEDEVYMILNETLHRVWVIKYDGSEEPIEIPKHFINMTFKKVDPKVIEVLYGNNKN